MLIAKVSDLTEEQKAKVRELAQADIPIEERRKLYNRLERRMKNPHNLKPGLIEKYVAAASSRKERFSLLKEFIIDENMSSPQCLRLYPSIFILTFTKRIQPSVPSSRSEVHVEAYFVQWRSYFHAVKY